MNEHINQLINGMSQGLVSQEDIESLNKAIAAGYGGAGKPTDLVYGGVLQAESLDGTLKSITFDMKNLKFWPAISIDKAYNLFEQYNRLIGVGTDSSPYIAEGGAPSESDSTYIRDGQRIVFFGERRKVSHQMTLVRTVVGDIVDQQVKEGTMNLLKKVERELYWAHAHFINQLDGSMSGYNSDLPVNSIAMNGLLKQLLVGDSDVQHRSGDFEGYGDIQSIGQDLEGAVVQQDDIERLAVIALENFGSPSEMHIEPAALSAFIKQFYPQFRTEPGISSDTVGYSVSKVTTSCGVVDFKPSLFLRPRSGARSVAVHAQAPVVGTFAAAANNNAAAGKLVAGTYQFKVTAVNDFGESAPIQATIAGAVVGTSAQLTISNVPATTKYFKVYRSAVGGAVGTEKFVGNYRYNASNLVLIDAGIKQPGLGEAFLLDMRAECMRFKQLSPLAKINFAIVTTALEFGLLLYGALFVYTPRMNCFFKNIGK